MIKYIKSFLIIVCALIEVQAQSEIVLRFLSLNRKNLTITKACDHDLKVISASLETNEVWALKCKFIKLINLSSK